MQSLSVGLELLPKIFFFSRQFYCVTVIEPRCRGVVTGHSLYDHLQISDFLRVLGGKITVISASSGKKNDNKSLSFQQKLYSQLTYHKNCLVRSSLQEFSCRLAVLQVASIIKKIHVFTIHLYKKDLSIDTNQQILVVGRSVCVLESVFTNICKNHCSNHVLKVRRNSC